MFELSASIEFQSAHTLYGYDGDCARLHGHNFVLEACVRSERLDSVGMSIDFKVLKGAMRKVTSHWDHQYLNELEDFKGLNPTAEVIAQVAYQRIQNFLEPELKKTLGTLFSIRVWETARCSAVYYGPS